MNFQSIIWDQDDDPRGNVQHIADHDLTVDDVEYVLTGPDTAGVSRSRGLGRNTGWTIHHRDL
jgi:hypothetical protein